MQQKVKQTIKVDNSFRYSPKVSEFLVALFNKYNHHDLNYCVLHSYERLPHYAPSDVDMAVAYDDLQKAEQAIFDVADSLGFKVIQKLYYDIPRCYFYVVSFRDDNGMPGFVQIDILNDDFGVGRYLLKTNTLLKDRRSFNGFWIPAVPVEACYLIIKKIVKGVILEEHEKKINTLFEMDYKGVRGILKNVFGHGMPDMVTELVNSKDEQRKKQLIRKLKKTLFVRYSLLKPDRSILKGFWLVKRILERIFSPTGLIIVFISPDGGGKSTIADLVQARLRYAFRNSTRIHWRPYFLPPPRKLFTPHKWHKPEVPNYQPHKNSISGVLNSFCRFIYYWLDYVIGYLPKILWPKIRTHLVVIERYYYDFLIDLRRYRLSISSTLPIIFKKAIPKPDHLFLLSGPEKVIYGRKQEIGLDEIRRQLSVIHGLTEKIPNSHIIRVDQLLESEVQQVEDIILDSLQKRLRYRTGH